MARSKWRSCVVLMYVLMFGTILTLLGCTRSSSDSGLIADWRFEAGADRLLQDRSGKGNTVTLEGGEWRTVGKASYLQVSSGTGIARTTTTGKATLPRSYSVTAAVRLDSLDRQQLLVTAGQSAVCGWSVYALWQEGRLALVEWSNGKRVGYVSDPLRVSSRTWHHVAVVRADTGVQFYIDGRPLGTSPATSPSCSSLSTFVLLGRRQGESVVEGLVGAVASIQMYSSLLTASYVENLAKQPFPE